MRVADWLLGLAALVFLSFPVVSLLGGWHGDLRSIGLVTALGFVALGVHALAAPPARFRVVVWVALFGAAAFGLLIAVNFSAFLAVQGNLVLFLLAAVGTAGLALDRPALASWYLWATAGAWLVEGLLLTFASQTPVALTRTLDGIAAAGLVAAFVCSRGRAWPERNASAT